MTRNRPIYHCPCCGAVVRQEAFRLPPFCCGREMVKAAEETVQDDFAHGSDLEPPRLNEPQVAPHSSAEESERVSL